MIYLRFSWPCIFKTEALTQPSSWENGKMSHHALHDVFDLVIQDEFFFPCSVHYSIFMFHAHQFLVRITSSELSSPCKWDDNCRYCQYIWIFCQCILHNCDSGCFYAVLFLQQIWLILCISTDNIMSCMIFIPTLCMKSFSTFQIALSWMLLDEVTWWEATIWVCSWC